jgi:prepilin-type N-terminal cleavage/methylation domain-containing protein
VQKLSTMLCVNKNQKKINKGFTLVELLIAVSLIAILTGVMLAVLNPRGIQAKARDAQRASDLAKVKVALESYYADNRAYPLSVLLWKPVPSLNTSNALDSKYINKLPEDPKKTSNAVCTVAGWRGYGYKSTADGQTYALVANMELTSSANPVCPFANSAWCALCNVDGTAYFATPD